MKGYLIEGDKKMRIAVDIGFGFVKVMSEHGEKFLFPSVIANRNDNSLKSIIGGTEDDYSITYWEIEGNNENEKINTRKCYVGDAGLTNNGIRRWEDKDQFNIDELKIFISTAIGLVNANNDEVDLCVGLPMSYYLQKKDELIQMLETINARVSYTGIKNVRKIKIKSIFVFPQGAGAYYSAICDKEGEIKDYNLATTSVGIVDIGYRTVDFLVMGKGRKGITMFDTMSGSLEEDGMNKAYQEIESEVSKKIGSEIGIIEVEKALLWFGGQLDYLGEAIDLLQFEEGVYKSRAEVISSKIKLKWGKQEERLSTVLITGGGGEEVYEAMQEKFKKAKLQKNATYANCEGYLGAQARKMKG